MDRTPISLAAGEGTRLRVLQDSIRVLAGAEHTAQQYEVFEYEGGEGSGPPPHSHPWDEAYFFVEGEVELHMDGRSVRAAPGAFALVPRGMTHAFRVCSPRARFVVLTAASGAGAFFAAMDREIDFPHCSMADVVRVAVRQGLRLEGMPA